MPTFHEGVRDIGTAFRSSFYDVSGAWSLVIKLDAFVAEVVNGATITLTVKDAPIQNNDDYSINYGASGFGPWDSHKMWINNYGPVRIGIWRDPSGGSSVGITTYILDLRDFGKFTISAADPAIPNTHQVPDPNPDGWDGSETPVHYTNGTTGVSITKETSSLTFSGSSGDPYIQTLL